MAQPVVHFEISARDGQTLKDFYSGLFGWPISSDNPMNYGLASTREGDTGIDGGIYQQMGPEDQPGLRVYAQVDDADAYLRRAEELGGKLVQPAQEVPGMGIKAGIFADPEGNAFGVVQNI